MRHLRWWAGILASLCLGGGSLARAEGVQHAFLVQNSGWMEPFYTDPRSPFKPLIAAVAGAVAGPQDKVITLAFSQSTPGNVSPLLLSSQQGAGGVAPQLERLSVARKSAQGALADTDFKEAVTKTITGPFNQAPGILWIFTNNKNSPNNDAQTSERNRDFYRLLHVEPSITKTLVFPLRMPVKGQLYGAQGLMVYALAYGAPASEALDQIVNSQALKQVLTHAPARLKPIDHDPLRIVPQRLMDTPNMQVSLAKDQRTLLLDVDPTSLVPEVRLQASLENLFYPYTITRAQVSAAMTTSAGRTEVGVQPDRVGGLQPGAQQPVEVRFRLPVQHIPSAWSMQALAALGKQLLIPMSVDIQLSEQSLQLSDAFALQLKELFPGDPISEVFTPPAGVKASEVRIPLLLRVQYPLAPLVVVIGVVLVLLGLLLAWASLGRQTRRFELVVDGVRRKVVLKRFSLLPLLDEQGKPIAELHRGWHLPEVRQLSEGHTVTFVGR